MFFFLNFEYRLRLPRNGQTNNDVADTFPTPTHEIIILVLPNEDNRKQNSKFSQSSRFFFFMAT